MASTAARVSLRLALAVVLILLAFYAGRPLYWKLSATVHDIRHNCQTVQQGISQIVREAQKSVGWAARDESDPGSDGGDRTASVASAARRILRN